jgi:hypothetical protein
MRSFILTSRMFVVYGLGRTASVSGRVGRLPVPTRRFSTNHGATKELTTPGGEGSAEIMWSNPRHNLSKVPDAVIFALPPPMRAPFPETAEAKRARALKSWAPAILTAAVVVSWLAYAKSQPNRNKIDLDKVPDFLQRAIEKQKAGQAALPPAGGSKSDPQ